MGQRYVADSGPTDEALLAGMAVGEQAAVVAFVRRYQRRVFGLAYSLTADPTLAEEVAQESLIRVWRHAPIFDPRRGSVASWVLTITRNLTIDALRMRRAIPTDPDDFAASALMSLGQPEDGLQRDDARDMVRSALLRLPWSSAVPSSWPAPMAAQRSRSAKKKVSHSARRRRASEPD